MFNNNNVLLEERGRCVASNFLFTKIEGYFGIKQCLLHSKRLEYTAKTMNTSLAK